MKNSLHQLSAAPCELDALLIVASVITFFGLLAFVAPAAHAETVTPDRVRFNNAGGTTLTAKVNRPETLVYKRRVVAIHGK